MPYSVLVPLLLTRLERLPARRCPPPARVQGSHPFDRAAYWRRPTRVGHAAQAEEDAWHRLAECAMSCETDCEALALLRSAEAWMRPHFDDASVRCFEEPSA